MYGNSSNEELIHLNENENNVKYWRNIIIRNEERKWLANVQKWLWPVAYSDNLFK